MRILQVVPYFAPAYAYGGPPETVHKLSLALARRGNEVTVLSTDAFDSSTRQPFARGSDGLHVHYVRNLSNYLAWNHQLFLPIGTAKFLRERLVDFDIVHVHMFRTFQNVLARWHSFNAGVPYVLSAHGSVPPITRKIMLKRLFDSVVGRHVLDDATCLVAVSSAEARQYMAMGVPDSKIAVIPNGVDAKQFSALPPRGNFSRQYKLGQRKLVTYVGRLNVRKGLDTLLESVHRIIEVREDIMLVLVGPDDGYRGHIEQTIKRLSLDDHVLLTGLITLPQKLEVLVDSDVVVYPGVHEIFGLVPFEAMLCGRSVVVADDSGCGEIVASARAGLTVPPGDSVRLQAAIQYILDNPESATEMAERGRTYILERLDWDHLAVDMERIYRTAAGTDGH